MIDLPKRLFGVVRKEIVELIRQPGLVAILVIGPLAILMVFGSGVRTTDPAIDAIFVIPPDNTEVSDLVDSYAESQSERLTISDITTDGDAAMQELRRGNTQVVITIPDVDTESIEQNERQTIEVRHLFIDPLEAQAIRLFTDSAVDDINDRLVASVIEEAQTLAEEQRGPVDNLVADANPEALDEAGLSMEDAEALQARADTLLAVDPSILARPLVGDAESIGGQITTSQFYAPAVVALILQHLTITFVALSVSREREQGTTELFAVSPLRSGERVIGKVLAYLVIGAALGAVMLVAVITLLGAPFRGGAAQIALVLGLELVASIGIGFVLAWLARNTTQVVQGSMLLLLLSVFFGGLLLSPDRLLDWARPIGWVLPMTHAIELLRDLMLRGIQAATQPLIALGVLSGVSLVLGTWGTARSDRPD